MRGIGPDGESRSVLFAVSGPLEELARQLRDEGWKYAQLRRDGSTVGEVGFDPRALRRTWWTR